MAIELEHYYAVDYVDTYYIGRAVSQNDDRYGWLFRNEILEKKRVKEAKLLFLAKKRRQRQRP